MATILSNKTKIYYKTKGQGDVIVFIHGLGSSTLDWEYQIKYLSDHYKTISLDLRGHGQSDSSKGNYSIKQFAIDVAIILNKEKAKAHIIGISLGGMVAFQLALDNPELVKSLIIINSFTEFLIDNKQNRKALRMRKLIPRIFGMRIMGIILGKKLFPKKNQKELRKLISKRWAKNSIKDYIKATNAIAGWTITKQLDNINCPVLVIASEFDYTSIESKNKYTSQLPNAELTVIEDARHAVTAEKPDEVNKLIFDFLKKIST